MSSTGLVSRSAASAGSWSAMPVSSPAIPSSSELLPGSAMPLISKPAKAFDLVPVFGFVLDPDSVSASGPAPHPLVVPIPEASDSVLSTGLVSRSTMPVESSPFYEPSLGFGLSKSQIWLLERIKDWLKIHEDVKDEDHSTFLKEMEEFRWINLVAREKGRLLVDEEDIRWICTVACEDGRWEVDQEVDDQKVAWLNEMKEELRLMVEWPGPMGKIISL